MLWDLVNTMEDLELVPNVTKKAKTKGLVNNMKKKLRKNSMNIFYSFKSMYKWMEKFALQHSIMNFSLR